MEQAEMCNTLEGRLRALVAGDSAHEAAAIKGNFAAGKPAPPVEALIDRPPGPTANHTRSTASRPEAPAHVPSRLARTGQENFLGNGASLRPNAIPRSAAAGLQTPDANPHDSPTAAIGARPDPEQVGRAHSILTAASVYMHQLARLNGGTFMSDTATLHMAGVLTVMESDDPIEQMLVAQAVWTHTRVGILSEQTAALSLPDTIDRLSSACDAATATFCRVVQALTAYREHRQSKRRRRRRTPDSQPGQE